MGNLDQGEVLAAAPRSVHVADPSLYARNDHWAIFDRLRAEDPVHYCAESPIGPYWAVTRFDDIMEVETNHEIFSSHNAVNIDEIRMSGGSDDATPVGGFLAMDPPDHTRYRRSVAPALAPNNMANFEKLIRQRTSAVLDSLPIGESFDWVSRVSVELTQLMLATLIDYPVEDKARLKRWVDVLTSAPGEGHVATWEERDREIKQMAATMLAIREGRGNGKGRFDLISMMIQASGEMPQEDYIANVGLLLIGGSDTTRNSMSGGILAFHDHPGQWDRLKVEPGLMRSAAQEVVRYQSPVIYMSRRATQDYTLRGKTIRKGDKVALFYVSGNRDESVFSNPYDFIIDREHARRHASFGFGIHRCVGDRLAELQLRILFEEILRRGWSRIEVTGTPKYQLSNIMRGIDELVVRIHG